MKPVFGWPEFGWLLYLATRPPIEWPMMSTDSGGIAVEVESSARASFNCPVYKFKITSMQRAANLEIKQKLGHTYNVSSLG